MNNDASPSVKLLTNLSTAALVSVSTLLQSSSADAASPSAPSLTSFPTGIPSGNGSSAGTKIESLSHTYGSTGMVGGLGTGSGGPGDQPAWLPASVTMVRGACLIVFSVLGAGFNTFMIVAIAPNRRLRTVRNILLVHLGAVGLLSSMFTTAYPAIATFHVSYQHREHRSDLKHYTNPSYLSLSLSAHLSYPLSFSVSVSVSFSLTPSPLPSLSLSLSLSFSFSLSLSLSPLSLTLFSFLCLCLSVCLSVCLSLSVSLCLSSLYPPPQIDVNHSNPKDVLCCLKKS